MSLVMGGMLVTAFLPVYISVKKKSGTGAGNAYASNLLTLVTIFLGVLSILCMIFPAQVIYTQTFYSDQSSSALATFFLPVLRHSARLLRRLVDRVGPSERKPRLSVVFDRSGGEQRHRHRNLPHVCRDRAHKLRRRALRHRHRQPARRLRADGHSAPRAQAKRHPPAPPHRPSRPRTSRHPCHRRADVPRDDHLVRDRVGHERCLLLLRRRRPLDPRILPLVVHAALLLPRHPHHDSHVHRAWK